RPADLTGLTHLARASALAFSSYGMDRDAHGDAEAFARFQHLEPMIPRLAGQVEGVDGMRHRLETDEVRIRGGREHDIAVQRPARFDIRREASSRPGDPRLAVPAVEPVVDPTGRKKPGLVEI